MNEICESKKKSIYSGMCVSGTTKISSCLKSKIRVIYSKISQ